MMRHSNQHAGLLRAFFGLASLEGLLTLAQLLNLPGGLSAGRLLLIAPAALLTLACLWALLRSWRRPDEVQRQATRLADGLRGHWAYWGLLGLCGLVCLAGIYTLLLSWKDDDPYVISYLIRLAPFVLWATLLSAQGAVVLRWLRYGDDERIYAGWQVAVSAGLIALVLLLLLSAWMAWTKIGLAPDIVAWGDPGVPILPGQIAAALAITAAVGLSGNLAIVRLRKSGLGARGLGPGGIDLLACLCLWGVAVWRWGAEPIRPSYFSPTPVPPNQEYYPYSDAAIYDSSAQSLLAGYGLGDVVRPLYSAFLALAQGVSGIGYQKALAWQIPLLALIPPLMYLLGKTLHNRLSGIFVGLLAVLHESNSISLADVANVSHAKLLMSDLPATLGVLAITAVIVLWMAGPRSRKVYPLLAGGILALATLVRAQIMSLLPVLLVAVWMGSRRDRRVWINLSLLAGGFLAAMLPWLWRNWQVSGRIALSEASQTSQIGLIGQRYSLVLDEEGGRRLPGESDDAYTRRMIGSALRFVREHPAETARFQAGHFLHNQVATLLVLPSDFPLANFLTEYTNGMLLKQDPNAPAVWERCCSLHAYVKNSGYWSDWDGEVPAQYGLPLLASLVLLATGIGTAWSRGRGAGLLPLAVNAAYSLSNALVRNSGWRFNLPVDWVGYLYYAIGLAQLCLWGLAFFRNKEASLDSGALKVEIERSGTPSILWRQAALVGIVFFAISAAIPLAELAIPERYREVDVQAIIANLQEKGIDSRGLATFLSQDGAQAMVGRGMYPRYHLAGQGEPGSGWPSYAPRDYGRLGFYLIGPERRQVILRTPEAPDYFPNASDVLVLGCSEGDYLDADVVVVMAPSPVILVRSPLEKLACPGS